MQSRWATCVLLMCAAAGYAKSPKPYQTAKLLQMNSVACGTVEKDAASPLGEIIGTDNHNRKSEQVLCQEYVLQADAMIYRVRPQNEKHAVLLPVGAQAQFRIDKDKMMLRVEGVEDKERPYVVVSMVPRAQSNAAEAATAASSH